MMTVKVRLALDVHRAQGLSLEISIAKDTHPSTPTNGLLGCYKICVCEKLTQCLGFMFGGETPEILNSHSHREVSQILGVKTMAYTAAP